MGRVGSVLVSLGNVSHFYVSCFYSFLNVTIMFFFFKYIFSICDMLQYIVLPFFRYIVFFKLMSFPRLVGSCGRDRLHVILSGYCPHDANPSDPGRGPTAAGCCLGPCYKRSKTCAICWHLAVVQWSLRISFWLTSATDCESR